MTKSIFRLKKSKLTLLSLLFPLFFSGQSLTGLWTGALHNDSSTVRKDQLFEIALTEYKGKVYGYSRSEFIVNDTLYYIVKRVKGTIDGDVCEVTDDEIVSYSFRGRLDKGIKVTSTFRRNQTDSAWYLDGTWKTNATRKYYSVTGKISLSEEKDLAASKLFPHLEELKLADDVAFYKERTETIATVKVAKPEKINTSYTVNPEILTTQSEPVIVSASPAVAITPTVEPAEEKKPSIKKTTDDLAKTGIKSIPADTDLATPSSSSASVVIKKTEAPVVPAIETRVSSVSPKPIETVSAKPVVNNSAPTSVDPVAISTPKKLEPVIASAKNNLPATTSSLPISENKPVKTAVIVKNNPPVTNNQPAATATKKSEVNKPDAALAVKPITQTVPATTVKTEPAITTPPTIAAAPEIKKPAVDVTEKAAVVGGRKSEFSQVVNFKSDSLIISLYDNGEIDGDTVSVFMNGETILSRQGLKSSAIKKTIYLAGGQNDEFTLVMFAESLGKYPPNTGLLVIRDGDDVYNLRFSSDFQKNAGIVFRRKK
ncbi:MAG: hypothetical protein JNM19_04200 [Chitinophagaceae bacterium]|nr:hypothetical protein [Chitinophagaceae bacterium]